MSLCSIINVTFRPSVYCLISLATFLFSTSSKALIAQELVDDQVEQSLAAVSYAKDVLPILRAKCHGCHQPAKDEGEYVMTDFDRLLAGGESGDAAIVPGDIEASYLVDLITPVDGFAEMPLDSDPLTMAQVEVIRRWINSGAVNDLPKLRSIVVDALHPPTYEANPVITALDFSPDGKWLAVSGYHEVLLFYATDFELAGRFVGLSERIESVVFAPDSSRLAVAGGLPGRKGELQIWEVASQQLLLSHSEGFDTLYGASWNGTGEMVAFGCPDNSIRAINSETGQQLLFNGAHDDWVIDTVFSTKSDHLVTVSRDRSMKLINVGTQRFVDNITSITPGALKGGLNAVECHPSRDELLTGGADGVPKLYRMLREKARKIGDDFNLVRAYPAMQGRVYDVRFSADGGRIVAGSSYNGVGQIRVYQTDDAKQILNIDVPQGGVFAVDFTHDASHIAAGGFDGIVRVFDTSNGELTHEISPREVTQSNSQPAESDTETHPSTSASPAGL